MSHSTLDLAWQKFPALSLAHSSKLISEWDRLNAARGDLPFLSSDAIARALKTLGNGTELLLVGHLRKDVAAMFVLTQPYRFQWRTFQPSQLPLGAWVAEPQLELVALSRSLLRGPIGFCLGLSITQIDPQIASRIEDTPDSYTTDYIETGWVDVVGCFDDYWSARGKNLRQNMRKQRAKLLDQNVKLSMQVLRSHEDMGPAVARYGDLESTGWKAKENTAIHPGNVQGHYYTKLLQDAAVKGEAAVYQYLFDDRIVAMDLCLIRRDTMTVLKTTYDESIKSYSPACLLREAELREIFREGHIMRIEYFGRLMDWHSKLTDKRRTLYHQTIYRWPVLKRAAQIRRSIVGHKKAGALPKSMAPLVAKAH